MFRWIKQLQKSLSTPTCVRRPIKRHRVVLKLEKLEDRVTPSLTYTVDLGTDNGGAGGQSTGQLSGDLRYCASKAVSGDTIDIAANLPNDTIDLNSQIYLNQNVTINGPGDRTSSLVART